MKFYFKFYFNTFLFLSYSKIYFNTFVFNLILFLFRFFVNLHSKLSLIYVQNYISYIYAFYIF